MKLYELQVIKIQFENCQTNLVRTVPIIKRGPELLQSASILSPSNFEQSSLFLKVVTIFAPTG